MSGSRATVRTAIAATLVMGGLVAASCGVDVGVSQGESRPADGPTLPATSAPSTEPRPSSTPAPTTPESSAGTDPGTVPDLVEPPLFDPEPIVWEPFTDATDVAVLDVPIDYSDPAAGTIELFVTRHRATDPGRRIGSLLVNPGGPGFGGTDYALFARQIYDADLLEVFDVVGWDPRGTGESYPAIDCIDDYDRYFASLDSAVDREATNEALARELAAECERRNPEVLAHVGTNNSARDMDTLRRALGEETVSYFGFSYGSELGSVWATLFPETVRAAVFDGAADPTADGLESSLQQMAGFQASIDRFLAGCSADESCAFHNGGDAEGAFDQLLDDLEARPIPGDPGRPLVGRGVATNGILMAMYADSYWPRLARALDAATRGDGSGLLGLHDNYFQRLPDGTWGNELEAFQAISCADDPERPDTAELIAQLPRYVEVAPRLFDESTLPGYFCTFFPPALDPRIDVTAAGAGPIVVLATTGDPTTPLESSRTMAATLEDGRLVTVESNDHGAYFASACARRVVASYLIDLDVPADGADCG